MVDFLLDFPRPIFKILSVGTIFLRGLKENGAEMFKVRL